VAMTKVNLTTFMCRRFWNLEASTPGTHRAVQACAGTSVPLYRRSNRSFLRNVCQSFDWMARDLRSAVHHVAAVCCYSPQYCINEYRQSVRWTYEKYWLSLGKK